MLNPFPQLLVYTFFAPTLLRIAAACILFIVAQHVAKEAKTLGSISFPFIGKSNKGLILFAAAMTALVALALFVGYGTQWAAILAILIAIKMVWFKGKLEPSVKLHESTYMLLIVICISLLLTGAGAYAFDLPL
jgi:hypothetical protein